jgi:hypothetical protein
LPWRDTWRALDSRDKSEIRNQCRGDVIKWELDHGSFCAILLCAMKPCSVTFLSWQRRRAFVPGLGDIKEDGLPRARNDLTIIQTGGHLLGDDFTEVVVEENSFALPGERHQSIAFRVR